MTYHRHCRFEGTYNELLECYDHLQEEQLSIDFKIEGREEEYKNKLLRLCKKIVDNYGEE